MSSKHHTPRYASEEDAVAEAINVARRVGAVKANYCARCKAWHLDRVTTASGEGDSNNG